MKPIEKINRDKMINEGLIAGLGMGTQEKISIVVLAKINQNILNKLDEVIDRVNELSK